MPTSTLKTKKVTVKKKCCKKDLRCAQCPVVLMRLEKQGYASRSAKDKRRYWILGKVPKKILHLARRR